MNPISSISNVLPTATTHAAGLDSAAEKKLHRSCQAMESLFARYLLSGITGGTPGLKEMAGGFIVSDMFREAVANKMAEGGSLGIAKILYQEVARTAEMESKKTDGSEST